MIGDFKSSFRSSTKSSTPKTNQKSSSSSSSSSSQSNGNNNSYENQNPLNSTNYRAIFESYGESAKMFFSKTLSRIILFFTQLSEQNKMVLGVALLGILFYFLIHAGDNGGGGMFGSRVDRGRGRGERSKVGEAYHSGFDSSLDSDSRTEKEREREGALNSKNKQESYGNRKTRSAADKEAEAAAGIHSYSTRANTKRKKEYDEKFPSPSPFASPFTSPSPIRSSDYDDTNRYDNNREIPQYYDHGNQHYEHHNYDDSSFFGNFGYIFDTTYGLSWPLWTAILAGAYKLPPYFPDQLGPQYARPFFGMNMVNFTMFLNMFSNSMRGRGRGGGFGGFGGIANMFNRRRY